MWFDLSFADINLPSTISSAIIGFSSKIANVPRNSARSRRALPSTYRTMKRIAFYGGSFDPPHNGHLTIARKLTEIFELNEFIFVPAFHAPHKKDKNPTSPFHRFAMLALATANESKIKVSKIELEFPEKPYTFETLTRLKNELKDTRIFFVMGADSWQDITTWREWKRFDNCDLSRYATRLRN